MSVNRIKASYAEFEGEYMHITRCPIRPLWFLGGVFFGFFVVIFMIEPLIKEAEVNFVIFYYSLFVLFSGLSFLFFAGEKEEYLVPKADILAIKKYPESRKVTVVLDDERTKWFQPVRRNK